MSEEHETIKIDEVDYAVEDLSESAMYCISQINEIQVKMQELNRERDRYEKAFNAYSAMLNEELKDVPVENPVDDI